MSKQSELIVAMTEYERNVPHRVGHFLKVYGYAKAIGETEGLPEGTQFALETAAIVHDIGIKPSLEKYGNSLGKNQEREGGAVARQLLVSLGLAPAVIDRVVYLVERHHTYVGVDGLDYQILLEADFLVNMLEEGMTKEAIQAAYDNVFETDTGKRICRLMYLGEK
ncbi:MAG: HD domain-containing protein [Deltaproteobacteria bacterium]|jgi:HD superfamily phosphodiesterase|nr:HD domain-containing protein [Deltaproteobacteria bacterium]